MFFKKKYIDKEVVKEFQEEYSFEFALAFYEGNFDPDITKNIVDIVGFKNEEQEIIKTGYLDFTIIDSGKITTLSNSEYNDEFTVKKYKEKFPTFDNIEIKKLSEQEIKNRKKHMNVDKYNEAKELLSTYRKEILSKEIFDKNNNQFKIKIIENDSLRYNEEQSLDVLYLYDEKDKQIGYLKMIYVEAKFFNHYNPTAFHMYNNAQRLKKKLPLKYTSKSLLESLEENYLIRNVNYDDPDKELKRQERNFKYKHKKILTKYKKETKNMATSQYSRVGKREDQATKNTGLGQLMYFYMSQHFKSKGVSLSSSKNQTDEAKFLWKSLNRNFSDRMSSFESTYMDDKVVLVNTIEIEKDDICYFDNGILKRESKLTSYLTQKNNSLNKRKNNVKKPNNK